MNNDFESKSVPFIGLILAFYYALCALIVVGSFGIAIIMMPVYWKRIWQAKSTNERVFYCMQFASMWCMFYAIAVIILITLDVNFGRWNIVDWWPTLSFMLFDWDMSRMSSIGCDVFLSLMMIPLSLIIGRMFGKETRDGHFQRPRKVVADEETDDVMQRYNAVLLKDPKKHPDFWKLPANTKEVKLRQYQKELLDMQSRVRAVYERHGRPNPIDRK